MSQAIGNDASNEFGMDDAADELMKLWGMEDADESQPSDEPEDEDNEEEDRSTDEDESEDESADEPDDSEDEDETEEDDEQDEPEEDEKPKKGKVLEDDAVVKVKIGDAEEEVPVAKLKRLYGQEKVLTQKSMEVAETRKTLESLGERHVAAAAALAERAKARFEPYAKIDWALAVKELDTDEYKALRDEATRAYQDVQFYEQEVEGYVGEIKKAKETERLTIARTTLKNLSDPKKGIPGFNEQMYREMGQYAANHGMSAEAFANIVEEAPLRIIAKAMAFDKGKKAVTKTVDKKNKKIVKSRTAPAAAKQTFSKSSSKDAMSNLRRSGSQEDAAAALLARWSSDD